MTTTYYTLPDGRHTTSYEAFKDAKADHAAAQAAFDNRFGAAMSTPEGRRAAVDAMRAGASQPMTVRIAPVAPKFKGGMSEAQVERLVDVASTGVTNRHGAEVFPMPSAPPQAVANALPAGMTRVNFFSGQPSA